MANSYAAARVHSTSAKQISPIKQIMTDAPSGNSKSGMSPISSNKEPKPKLNLVIDTKDDKESERNCSDATRVATTTQPLSPISKLISDMRSEKKGKHRLQTFQSSPRMLSTKQLVNSKYGAVSPKSSKSDAMIDAKDDIASGGLSSPSLFQQSGNKVGMLQDSTDRHDRQQISPKPALKVKISSNSPTVVNADPSTPMSNASSAIDLQTAARVGNFIDSLHQQKATADITSNSREAASNNTSLPPKSPSLGLLSPNKKALFSPSNRALLSPNARYSSVLENARSVIASSPVSKAKAGSFSNGSPQTNLKSRTSFLQKSAERYRTLDSDDDSSYSSDSSGTSSEAPSSTQKEVGKFIDSLKTKNEPKVKQDMELLSSMKTKLNMRKSEKETTAQRNREILSSFKAQLGVQDNSTKRAPMAAKDERLASVDKKDKTTKPTTLPPDNSISMQHNIKKDVNYYAILSQIQKAVQSDNPSLMIGKVLADAGKRGMKLAVVTEMIKDEKLKARTRKTEQTEAEALVRKESPNINETRACVEQHLKPKAPVVAKRVGESVEKAECAVKNVKNQSTAAPVKSPKGNKVIDQQSQSSTKVLPETVQEPSISSDVSPSPKASASSQECKVVSTPTTTKDTPRDDSVLMSEVEAKIKDVVRSATPSIDFGKVLADAKKKGLPTDNLIRLYKKEREEVTNAAIKAASMVIKPEDDEASALKSEDTESDSPTSGDTIMKEKLTKDVKNAVSSSNAPEKLGKIIAEAKSNGMPTEWLIELYTKERMQMQVGAAKNQGAKTHSIEVEHSESEVSDVFEALDEFSDGPLPNGQPDAHTERAPEIDDFFAKFSLQTESKDTAMDSSVVRPNLVYSVSEVSEHQMVDFREEIGRARESESQLTAPIIQGISSSSDASIDNNANAGVKSLWKSPLQKKRLSKRKLNKGGKDMPINGVAAAAALSGKRRLHGPRRSHLMQTIQKRTKEHRGFLDIDFYSLYEATTCHGEDEEIDKAPWEYRDVRQRFLAEKSVDCRNWFGSFEPKLGNDRVSNPVACPKSLLVPATKIPESGEWNEDWFTTWKSRRDNPNNLVTFTEEEVPALTRNFTSGTSTTMAESESDEKSMAEEVDAGSCPKKAVLIEIGNLVSVRFGGERVSKVHPDYTSSLRRSRWRKKYMRGEFAFNAEM